MAIVVWEGELEEYGEDILLVPAERRDEFEYCLAEGVVSLPSHAYIVKSRFDDVGPIIAFLSNFGEQEVVNSGVLAASVEKGRGAVQGLALVCKRVGASERVGIEDVWKEVIAGNSLFRESLRRPIEIIGRYSETVVDGLFLDFDLVDEKEAPTGGRLGSTLNRRKAELQAVCELVLPWKEDHAWAASLVERLGRLVGLLGSLGAAEGGDLCWRTSAFCYAAAEVNRANGRYSPAFMLLHRTLDWALQGKCIEYGLLRKKGKKKWYTLPEYSRHGVGPLWSYRSLKKLGKVVHNRDTDQFVEGVNRVRNELILTHGFLGVRPEHVDGALREVDRIISAIGDEDGNKWRKQKEQWSPRVDVDVVELMREVEDLDTFFEAVA